MNEKEHVEYALKEMRAVYASTDFYNFYDEESEEEYNIFGVLFNKLMWVNDMFYSMLQKPDYDWTDEIEEHMGTTLDAQSMFSALSALYKLAGEMRLNELPFGEE